LAAGAAALAVCRERRAEVVILDQRLPDASGAELCPAILDTIRDNDPYTIHRVGQYELLPWNVMTGREDIDRVP